MNILKCVDTSYIKASSVDVQQVFKRIFKALIKEDYSIIANIERYENVLGHALWKVDIPVGRRIY